ncbi:3-oxoadipate enol-lactonase [Gordonia sp. VNQ95]|jgi:3-oxoadipate enol-lactonase|uniref:3-oxoadipate enol-lactonase n=1 Tax=Gordonia TaxID=2053 RepID=UPI0032B4CD97
MSAVEVAAYVSGRDDAPVVVLSNSLGSDHRMWDAQLPELEKHFRVVRYDTRGHGASPVPAGPYSIDDLADDVIALLDRLGVASAHVVGLSLGGMTAMRLAVRNPDRVNRIGLLCTAAYLPPATGWTDRAATVRAGGSGAVADAVLTRWFSPGFLADDANSDRLDHFREMIAATPSEGYAGCCEAIATMDQRADISAITAATLAIAGADDPATPPEMLAAIADSVPDAKLLVVDDAAHLANAEQPDTITPALIEHLENS